MTAKRFADLLVVVICGLPIAIILTTIWICAPRSHRQVFFYQSERMQSAEHHFRLIKLRTMISIPGHDQRTMGGDLQCHVTPFGSWLRHTRLDELPQIWNVLTGDMSLVGPRPPLRSVVARHASAYRDVLAAKVGVTGLATVIVCGWEQRLLSTCGSRKQTEATYDRRCLPRKIRIDRIYVRNQSIWLDGYVIYLTVARFLPLPGRRARRIWRGARPTSGTRPRRTRNLAKVVPGLLQALSPERQLSRSARSK